MDLRTKLIAICFFVLLLMIAITFVFYGSLIGGFFMLAAFVILGLVLALRIALDQNKRRRF